MSRAWLGNEKMSSVTYYDHLPSKPLVETILEVKWGAPDQPDPAYPLIVGRLYEKVQDTYGATEDLPLAQLPPSIAVHIPRHRFRVAENAWPLVQIGPGVAVLNDTEGYTWEGFRRRAVEFFPRLQEAHPRGGLLDITSLKLEYIDAIEFDHERKDVLEFVRDKLHVRLAPPAVLFDGQPVESRPEHALVQLAFATSDPKGRIQVTARTGRKEDRPAVILNTSVLSTGADAKEGWQRFGGWLDGAHAIIRHWFFALVQGDLLEEFRRS